MKLGDIAHARAGDKGRMVTISVTPYDAADYEYLRSALEVERVQTYLSWVFPGGLVRYEVHNLRSLLFVGTRANEDSVTISTAIDAHGKSLGSVLLELPLDADGVEEEAASDDREVKTLPAECGGVTAQRGAL